MLADIDKKVCTQYGAWGEKKMYGKSFLGIKRITYIINEKGVISHVWQKVSPKNHAQEILTALKKD